MRTNKLEVEIIQWDDATTPHIFLKSVGIDKQDMKNEIAPMLVSFKNKTLSRGSKVLFPYRFLPKSCFCKSNINFTNNQIINKIKLRLWVN